MIFLSELIINTEDLLHNINEIRSKVTVDNYTLIAVVKGNAYGLRDCRVYEIFNKKWI